MYILKVLIWIFGGLFVLFSCKSGVEIENINLENSLSISGLISPQDSLISIHVFKGRKIGTIIREDSSLVDNAVVSISDGNIKTILHYNRLAKNYQSVNPFTGAGAGTILYLTVEAPNLAKAEATALMPPRPLKPLVEGGRIGSDYRFTLNWDNIDAYKFYTIGTDVQGEIKASYGVTPLEAYIDTPDNNNFYLPSDKQDPNVNIETGGVGAAYNATTDAVILTLTVANIDETYFKFYKSYRAYQHWLDNSGEFIPNFSEPVPVFSNIKGGTGYFAAYNGNSVVVKLK